MKRNDSGCAAVSSRIANGIRNRITGETIRDTGCSLKAFRTEQIREVALFEGMHRFLPTLAQDARRTVVEVPSTIARASRTSKYGVWNRVFRRFLDCLAVRWMQWRVLRFSFTDVTPRDRADGQPCPPRRRARAAGCRSRARASSCCSSRR
jgi:hypothetical protein